MKHISFALTVSIGFAAAPPANLRSTIDGWVQKNQKALVRQHIAAQGWHVVDAEPDDETRARYPKIVRMAARGGTVPITPFIEALGFRAMSLPTVYFDNNQHGENENLRLGHFFRGVSTTAVRRGRTASQRWLVGSPSDPTWC